MKKYLYLSCMIFMLLLASCDEDEPEPEKTCEKTTVTKNVSINLFDLKGASIYYNQVVASFKFVQNSNSYKGTISCPAMDCGTSLIIQNITSKTMTLDYNIIFTLNFAQWNHQGAAVIAPGAQFDAGVVSTNCGNISLGSFLIQSANISYK